jgi:hypothetical protein
VYNYVYLVAWFTNHQINILDDNKLCAGKTIVKLYGFEVLTVVTMNISILGDVMFYGVEKVHWTVMMS